MHTRASTRKLVSRPFFVFLVCRLLFARLAAGFEAADLVIGDCVVGFERPDGGSLSRQPKFRPTRGNLIVDLLAQRGALGKDRKVAVLLASVDQCLRTVGSLF